MAALASYGIYLGAGDNDDRRVLRCSRLESIIMLLVQSGETVLKCTKLTLLLLMLQCWDSSHWIRCLDS